MSNNQVNGTYQEDYLDNTKNIKQSKNINFFIFLVCLLLAFIFWCYALYINDPVIQASVTVRFELVGGDTNDQLSTTSKTMIVYGKRSFLDNKTVVNAKIQRSDFNEYNKSTLVKIDFEKFVESENNYVYLEIINPNK